MQAVLTKVRYTTLHNVRNFSRLVELLFKLHRSLQRLTKYRYTKHSIAVIPCCLLTYLIYLLKTHAFSSNSFKTFLVLLDTIQQSLVNETIIDHNIQMSGNFGFLVLFTELLIPHYRPEHLASVIVRADILKTSLKKFLGRFLILGKS